MTPKLYFDGTDQYIMVRIGGIDTSTGTQSILTGEINGEELDECILVWSEYKKDDISIDNPSVIWNSFAGMWKVQIPAENITQPGTSWVNISGADIIPLAVETCVVFRIFDIQNQLTAIQVITDQLTLENINSQVDLAISDYDPPTKAELDVAVSPLATSANISSLHDISESQIVTQVGIALASYDPPTKTELDSAIAPLSTASALSSLNNLSESQIVTQVGIALASYDPPTKAELDAAIDTIPTANEILSMFDNEIIDGVYTRIQVERIIAAVMMGIRTKIDGKDRFTGLDGLTPRLVVELAPNNRSIVSRNGD